MNDKYLTVSQLNKYIKYRLDNDENLQTVFLKGEISNFKDHTSGHLYFTLKDEDSRILAIMFKGNASKLNFKPINGSKVLVIGKISVYEANGNYQIYIEEMLEDGVGNLYQEFEKLKKNLELKGYFDLGIKKQIPKYPKRIGIITASTGAAVRDIITTINRRYKLAHLYLYPSLVQGEMAKEDIVRNLNQADNDKLDVIILGRGGGSIEDLWAFNEEIVADAIYNAKTPIISAVGHEIDFTISDFVSDLRAPTPTAAAELAVPNAIDIIKELKQLELRTIKSLNHLIEIKQEKLTRLLNSYILNNPENLYEAKMQKLDSLTEKLLTFMKNELDKNEKRITNNKSLLVFHINSIFKEKSNAYINLINKLEVLNPLLTIKRGYTITKKDNKVITTKKDITVGETLETNLFDGKILSIVKEVK